MSKLEIIRAWKDQDYRASLTEEQRAQLPAHPSGAIEVRIRERCRGPGPRLEVPLPQVHLAVRPCRGR